MLSIAFIQMVAKRRLYHNGTLLCAYPYIELLMVCCWPLEEMQGYSTQELNSLHQQHTDTLKIVLLLLKDILWTFLRIREHVTALRNSCSLMCWVDWVQCLCVLVAIKSVDNVRPLVLAGQDYFDQSHVVKQRGVTFKSVLLRGTSLCVCVWWVTGGKSFWKGRLCRKC